MANSEIVVEKKDYGQYGQCTHEMFKKGENSGKPKVRCPNKAVDDSGRCREHDKAKMEAYKLRSAERRQIIRETDEEKIKLELERKEKNYNLLLELRKETIIDNIDYQVKRGLKVFKGDEERSKQFITEVVSVVFKYLHCEVQLPKD